jgi:hypothetical protein
VVKGSPKFDGLALGEGSFNFLGPNVQMKTKAAFINNATGQTHGWTLSESGWSKETMQALSELRTCIERDLAGIHLADQHEPSGLSASSSSTSAPPGLGEHLEGDDAPQV